MIKSYRIFLFILFILVIVTAVGIYKDFNTEVPTITQQSELISIPSSDLKDAVKQSFQKGSADILKPYLTEIISLDILETEEDLKAADAILQLEDFFLIHPPQKFYIKHDGVSKSGKGSYLVGIYEDTLNAKYRITFGTKDKRISNLTIEENQPLLWSAE